MSFNANAARQSIVSILGKIHALRSILNSAEYGVNGVGECRRRLGQLETDLYQFNAQFSQLQPKIPTYPSERIVNQSIFDNLPNQ